MQTKIALNSDIASQVVNGKAPDWIELIPAGPNVLGRDGRKWLFDELAAQLITSVFIHRAIDLPIDWEHATQQRAPHGEAAPAAGWINALQMRNGSLWGKISWTERGKSQVEAREYRYISPVFDYEPESSRIVTLVSAGLTNKPNLQLTALNHEHSHVSPRSLAMSLNAEEKQVAQVFGISDADFLNTRDSTSAVSVALSQVELDVAMAMGISPNDFLKAKL